MNVSRDEVMAKLLKLVGGGPGKDWVKVKFSALRLGESEDYANFLASEQRRMYGDTTVVK